MIYGITAKKDSEQIITDMISIIKYLNSKGIVPILSTEGVVILKRHNGTDGLDFQVVGLDDMTEKGVDVVICIGGDGTILDTLQRTDAQVVGIHRGSIGYLTEIPPDKATWALDQMLEGNYSVDEFLRLAVWVNGEYIGDCANEVVIHNEHISKLQEYNVSIEGWLSMKFRGDGVIVGTPMGSTSYSMSAGGPIMMPSVEAVSIIPMAPYTLASRPVVVRSDYKIKINTIYPGKRSQLVLDGQIEKVISSDDTVEIELSWRRSRFIRFFKRVTIKDLLKRIDNIY